MIYVTKLHVISRLVDCTELLTKNHTYDETMGMSFLLALVTGLLKSNEIHYM